MVTPRETLIFSGYEGTYSVAWGQLSVLVSLSDVGPSFLVDCLCSFLVFLTLDLLFTSFSALQRTSCHLHRCLSLLKTVDGYSNACLYSCVSSCVLSWWLTSAFCPYSGLFEVLACFFSQSGRRVSRSIISNKWWEILRWVILFQAQMPHFMPLINPFSRVEATPTFLFPRKKVSLFNDSSWSMNHGSQKQLSNISLHLFVLGFWLSTHALTHERWNDAK